MIPYGMQTPVAVRCLCILPLPLQATSTENLAKYESVVSEICV